MKNPKYKIGDQVIVAINRGGLGRVLFVITTCHYLDQARTWCYNGNIDEKNIIRKVSG